MGPMSWRAALAGTLGAALVAAAAAGAPKNIMDYSPEIRRRNWLRITTHSCDECVTIEDFYKMHPLAFVLFYERALAVPNAFKTAVVSGFFEACGDLRYSHVPCGVVDMVDDKAYAERYIKPESAPAHIVVREGKPVVAARHHIEPLMEKPGKKELMIWHINQLLVPDEEDGALEISREVADREELERLLKRHDLVLVCAGSSSSVREAFRAAAQRAVVEGDVPLQLSPATPEKPARKGDRKAQRRQRADRRRRRVLVLALHGKAAKDFSPEGENAVVAAYVRGERLPAARGDLTPESAKSEKQVLEVLQQVSKPAVEAAQAALKEKPEL